jgi:Fur family ferric uptake transcriptional regulator
MRHEVADTTGAGGFSAVILNHANRGTEILEQNELKKAGLKVTLPRVKILEIIETNPAWHMSAEDVYKELLSRGDDVGLATVYRVLTQFEAADILKRHQFEGGKSVFELISKGEHDHLVCIKSGLVEEFHDPVIQERVAAIAERHGFDMTDYSLVIYGISDQAKTKTKKK